MGRLIGPRRDTVGVGLIVLLHVMLICVGTASAQQSLIRGTVVDASSGESLQGVNVALFQNGALQVGGVSGDDGVYAISSVQAGSYELRATFVGFITYSESLVVGPNDRLIINIKLELNEEELGEVVVEDERGAGTARVLAGQTTITPADVELIPGPDISGDLVNYLTALPGVVSLGDRGGQLFIRGGEPWQNLVLLDGMWVYQPFHILGFFSSFPSEILKTVDVYAGGYTSQYGGRISSVIDIKSRNGDKKSYAASGSITPFVSGFALEGPIATDLVSFLVSYRTSVMDKGASKLIKEDLPFEFGDFFAKAHAFVSSNSQLSISVLETHDKGSIFEGSDVQGKEYVQWKNRSASARYLVFPRAFPIMAEFIVSATRLNSSVGAGNDFTSKSNLASANTNINVTHFNSYGDVKWGLFARTLELESNLAGQFQAVTNRKEYLTEVGIYIEPELRDFFGWNLRGGLRIHSFPSKNSGSIEPRFRAVKERETDQFSVALGSFHQEVVGLTDRRDASGVFTAWTSSPDDQKVPEALHAIVGYRKTFGGNFDVSLEAYAKKLKNLFIPEWTAYPRFTTRIQPAEGRVFGGDLRVEYRKGPFTGLVTYGISSVEYRAKQESIYLWYGEDELQFRPAHDRRHQVNAVAAFDFESFELNIRWQFGSGLPYSRALGFDGFMLVDGAIDVFKNPGSRRVIYERPYNGVLPTYHRLDVTLEKSIRFSHGVTLSGLLGVINAYDRTNLFYLDVFTLRRVNQLPIIPTFGLKLDFE
jgi:hypothetical protein